ncbi:CLUMA_CG006357, isoform A [Clunio marinus]|uniref:CLUMA_CG006357, isoform A n=1 Tax=Clunio marinus TaxID=568069 RepID=A0A1J1HZC3_9DIPT|nr:CLUMA_CG006357, isoform A [Clunio marinus]
MLPWQCELMHIVCSASVRVPSSVLGPFKTDRNGPFPVPERIFRYRSGRCSGPEQVCNLLQVRLPGPEQICGARTKISIGYPGSEWIFV